MTAQLLSPLRNAIESPISPDKQQWVRVEDSLKTITTQFRNWGQVLRKMSSTPNDATVEEMADALDDFEDILYDLYKWLDSPEQAMQHWVTLKHKVEQAQQHYNGSDTRYSLAMYYAQTKSRKRVDAAKLGEFTKLRFKAGEGIINFARELEQAVREAKVQLR